MQETLTKLKELQVLAVDLRYETEEKDNLIYIVPSATNPILLARRSKNITLESKERKTQNASLFASLRGICLDSHISRKTGCSRN